MSNSSKCPQCDAPLPENAPAGLCPNCLMALNLKTETVFTGDAGAAPTTPLPPGTIAPHFPQLEILECLGRGGMGVVYKARQKALNRLVALKLLAPERVGDAKFAERFTREAQALAALNHPNIVTIYDFGQAGGFYFLLMEFVDGVNLRQLLRTRKFTPEEALVIVPPLCDALQFAHEHGIVHRDIKPENLLLDKAGRVKVADFGIAKMLGNGGDDDGKPVSETMTQSAVGTPGYSAPEQKSDPRRVDSRADIYSLGVVFYEMLTGELPGKRIEPPSKKVQIDVRLDEVVLRALEKTPELRWQTAADLRTQVETIAASSGAAATSHPMFIGPSGEITPAGASRMRWKIVIWGLALAVAGISMNLFFGILGVLLLVVSAALALGSGNNLKWLKLACRIILIDGMVMASAAIGYAFNTSMLKTQWLVTIVAGCLLGIGYCLLRWKELNTLKMGPVNTTGPGIAGAGPAGDKFKRRLKKFFLVQLLVVFVIAMGIRAFFLQPFEAATDAAAPEIPRGSRFLVWTFAHRFAPGDLVAYRHEGWVSVGRVADGEVGAVSVRRNGEADTIVPPRDILGKVISVYWRASNGGSRPAGAAGVAGNVIETRLIEPWQQAYDLSFLDRLPPQMKILPSSPATIQSRLHIAGGRNGKGLGLGQSVLDLLTIAYEIQSAQVIATVPLPEGKYDFIANLPKDNFKAGQDEIKKTFGLAGRLVTMETNVLILKVKSRNATGLRRTSGQFSGDQESDSYSAHSQSLYPLVDYLERCLGIVIIDRTGLDGVYDIDFKWDSTPEGLKKALLEQAGLELVPGREPVQMLFVEKAE